MSDPDSGRAPQADGASVAERRKGKSSRRAKRKRGGQARPNALSAEANQTGKSGAVATRPADQDAGFPAKKRKRRRRSRGGAQDGAQHSSQSQQPQASAAPDQRAADEHGHASSNKSGKNRRKHRSKRGLQGRPLAHE
ncbi:exopolyphosphatase, partial [Agrobacterium sp. SHOUNA12C]|nr:exopolyphosphatase [Agrobacterium sp. SHOUNA12C]